MLRARPLPLFVLLGSLLPLALAGRASAEDRAYELRTYTAAPGKLEALHQRFRDHTLRLFEKHGMTVVGFWVPAKGDTAANTLVYLLSFPSEEARNASWKAFAEDPEWKKVSEESQRDGRMLDKVESVMLRPTDYSPLR
jgi:hypothetical protein